MTMCDAIAVNMKQIEMISLMADKQLELSTSAVYRADPES